MVVVVLVATFIAMGLAGCSHLSGEHPKGEHPKAEKAEHPTAEHPK